MRENIDELFAKLRKRTDAQILVDRLVRAVRQEKAAAHLEALRQEQDASVEALAEHLEYEMASALQDALEDGRLDPRAFVKNNRDTLKLIARGAAVSFRALA